MANDPTTPSILQSQPRRATPVGDKPQPGLRKDKFNEKGQYSITDYTYPTDLMSSDYGQNYVVFYINVSVDSKLLKDPSRGKTVGDFSPRTRSDVAGKEYTKGQAAAGTIAQATIAGGAVGAVVGRDFESASKVAGAAGLTTAVGVVAVGTQTTNFSRQQKRLETAIALHVPNTLNIRYGANWGEEDLAGFHMGATVGQELAKAFQGGGSKTLSTLGSVGAALGLNLPEVGNALQAQTGMAPNPRKEQLFKNLDFRTFQFDYQFYPRTEKEAANVLQIIKTFKYHMHPEFKDEGKFLYIYPSEFDIVYYQGLEENLNLHRHTSCVLTEMNVNYAPQGQFTTFANGMPTQINVTLNFKELALMSKELIDEGL